MAEPFPPALPGGMTAFPPHGAYQTTAQLEQQLRVCPSAEDFARGFQLPEAAVDELLEVAAGVQKCQIYADPAYPPEQNVDLLLRTIRVLQVSLDVQSQENDSLVNDYNTLKAAFTDLEEREQGLQAENDRLREKLDRDQAQGDVVELRRRNEELIRRLEEEDRDKQLLRQQRDRDERQLDKLDRRLQQAEEDLRDRDIQIRELQESLARLQDNYNDLNRTYESLRAEYSLANAKLQGNDSSRQQEWKIERLLKEKGALEMQNAELRKQAQDVKTENLEVSEKIVLLDDEARKLKLREADLEGRLDALAADKAALLEAQEGLRAEVAEKMTMLDEFEARFARQYKSWEEERGSLMAQIEALKRGESGEGVRASKAARRTTAATDAGASDAGSDSAELQELRDLLNEAKEKEVLLLEAYEQLEDQIALEIDKALGTKDEELKTAQRRVAFLEEQLAKARDSSRDAGDHQAYLEDQLKDAQMRNVQYEQGVYGLPQAVEEIHQLKEAVYKEEKRVRDLIHQINMLSGKVEDLHDENTVLRKQAGLPEGGTVDISGVRRQKDATIAQLRSLNALLERQVADLEEERRKMRMELKFRAKFQGREAMELGLNPEQLLLVEQYVDDLKHGRNEEGRVVDNLLKRIEFLEVRLGEVMAYSEIPPSMRPALMEFDPVSWATGQGELTSLLGMRGGALGFGNIRASQLEAVKGALLKSLTMLRQMDATLAEMRNVPGALDCHQLAGSVIQQLTDAERVVDSMFKEAAAGGGRGGQMVPGTPGTLGRQGTMMVPGSPGRGTMMMAGEMIPGDGGYLADAMADELRNRMELLARQCASLQATVIEKEAKIQQLVGQKEELERKFGIPLKDRPADFIPRQDYEDLSLEAASLKEQLVHCLEELATREREVHDLGEANAKYQTKLQTFADQLKMLYREYAVALSGWKMEKLHFEKRVKKLQEDVDGQRAAAQEYSRGLDVLSRSRALSEVEEELMDTVRRMAVVQVKHAKIARELEASTLGERALQERVEELEQEVRDVGSTCRSRMRWLETAADTARRRVEALFRELSTSVPLQSYQMLVEKHARVLNELRRCVEERGEAVVAHEEMFRLRDELAASMGDYDRVCDDKVQLSERVRQLELTRSKEDRSLDMRLAQELVAARVGAESAVRRAQLVEAERDRVQRTLQETQTRLREIEERLAQNSAELEITRASLRDTELRLMGAKTKAEVDELVRRLDAAEAAAAAKFNDYAALSYRAEEGERKLEQAVRDRQRHLAEITNLKAALRDVMGRSEAAAVVGKLHEALDHAVAKEALARNALNRSELQRIELEAELRKMKSEAAAMSGRVSAHQDAARWADKQRQEVAAALELSVAGRTEQWKAQLWARKLEVLKARNDTIADSLDLARRRIKKLEDAREAAELKLSNVQDVEALLRKGPSEVVRDAARLHEQLLQLRTERGRSGREEVLMREKVHYVERVNAELHELIEKYEAEFFQAQLQLEADKSAAVSQARALADEAARLQERLSARMAAKDTDDLDQARKSLYTNLKVGADATSRLKHHLATAQAGDREMMLKQIESLKTARQEAEHLRQEVHRLQQELAAQAGVGVRQEVAQRDLAARGAELSDVRRHHNDALARLEANSEGLLYALNYQKARQADDTAVGQMKAVAEATINELKARLKERDRQIDDMQDTLLKEKERWYAQHQTDRAEIERLNQRLFERNDASIGNMKELLSRIPKSGEAEQAAQLRAMKSALEATQEELALMRNQVEQKEAALEVLRNNYEAQLRKLEDELQRLRSEASGPREEAATARLQLSRLQGQLRTKDDKLRQLRDAFKALEGKLVEAHKKIADEAIQKSSWRDQEKLETMIELLEKDKQKLLVALQAAREDAEAARAAVGGDAAQQLTLLRNQLQEARDRATLLDAELAKTRKELQKLKNAERTVMDLTTGMSVEAKRQIEELQKRVNVLERQNTTLKRTLQAEDAAAGGSGGPGGGGPGDGPGKGSGGNGAGGGPTARGPQSRPGTSGSGAAAPGGATAAGRRSSITGAGAAEQPLPGTLAPAEDPAVVAAKNAAAVVQWEQNKKLTKQVEDLRKKLALKQEEAATVQKELDRRALQVQALQSELDKAGAALRDLQEKLRKAQSAPRLTADAAKLKELTEKLEAAEAARDEAQRQAAQAGQQAARTSSSGAGGAGGDVLKKDAEIFQLKLQRDQAQAQARRLKERLQELFGPEAESFTGPLPPAAGGGTTRGRSSGGGAAVLPAREAELMSTITNLKSALEKATASSTPTTKYMAEVARRKEVQKETEALKAEVERLRAQQVTLNRMMGDMQAANAELRKQLRLAQEEAAAGTGAGAAGSQQRSAAEAAAVSQVANLELLLAQRDDELEVLRGALEEREQALAATRRAGGADSNELASLRAALEDLRAENRDLKAELNAFDPKFFEEIEDLKHEHHVLGQRCDAYARLIEQMSRELGRPPPAGVMAGGRV